jgi:hypothetical protein
LLESEAGAGRSGVVFKEGILVMRTMVSREVGVDVMVQVLCRWISSNTFLSALTAPTAPCKCPINLVFCRNFGQRCSREIGVSALSPGSRSVGRSSYFIVPHCEFCGFPLYFTCICTSTSPH